MTLPKWIEDFKQEVINQMENTNPNVEREAKIFAVINNFEKSLILLKKMVEDYEEFDAYPTSDSHPLYEARNFLETLPKTQYRFHL